MSRSRETKTILLFSLLMLPVLCLFLADREGCAQMVPDAVFTGGLSNTEIKSAPESKPLPATEEKNQVAPDKAPAVESTEREVQEDQNIMEDALVLIGESDDYWKKGDLENALDLLDQAYSLIIETDDDPAIARQKDDLRLLISKKILAIYSARQTVTSGKRSEIPMMMNGDVEKEIRSFQSYERDFFIASFQRSGLYRLMIVRELKKAGLPEELSWLPLVESGFKISALSRARALGPWQFIPSTGYKYGLNRDDWIDERMDPQKSTQAAIGYLKDLHNMFGDWLTVLAAYNCGEGRVLRVISGQHVNYLDRFWDLYHQLPYETARYVPRFLATLQIIKDPAKYGMDLGQPMDKQVPYEEVNTQKSMKLQDIATALAIPEDQLNSLNSELRHRMTPDKTYKLKVPLGVSEKYIDIADSIPQTEMPRAIRVASKSGFKRHKVNRGETMASIARRYNVSVSALMACNGMSAKKRVRVGQRLKVPVRVARYAKDASSQSSDADSARNNGQVISYKVKKGDNLALIAQRFNTTVADIKKMNRIKGSNVQSGRIIKIAASNGDAEPAKENVHRKTTKKNTAAKATAGERADHVYTIKKGDSLARIAKKNSTTTEKLLELNNLDRNKNIRPGQVIVLK